MKMKDDSIQLIDKIVNNYIERNSKHLLFTIAQRGETIKIHSFDTKERFNFENNSKFSVPVFNYTSNYIDNGNLILNAGLNIFIKSKYEDKECTKLISTFNSNEIIDLMTLRNVYKNGYTLKPIIINCFVKIKRPFENGVRTEIVQSEELIFEILPLITHIAPATPAVLFK